MKTVRLDVPFTLREIGQGALDLLRANEFRQDVHFVPVAFFGMGAHNFNTLGPTVDNGVYITAVPWSQPQALWDGVSACVASWRRISDDTVPPRLKAGANYQNSRLAQTEATVDGYDTAIILNQRGTVAEGTGACLMMVRDGKLVTPPVTAGILESITRTTLMELAARELGAEVVEREVDRTELYVADEVFMCGSGFEALPITSVDRDRGRRRDAGLADQAHPGRLLLRRPRRAGRLPPLAHARVPRGEGGGGNPVAVVQVALGTGPGRAGVHRRRRGVTRTAPAAQAASGQILVAPPQRFGSRPRRAQGSRGSCAARRRTSTLPKRAPGIRPAIWTASSRSRASMR